MFRIAFGSERGSSLVGVIIVGLVVAVIGGSMAMIAQASIERAQVNEDSIQAHFYAISGVEIALEIIKNAYPDTSRFLEEHGKPADEQEWYFGSLGSGFVKRLRDNPPAEDYTIAFRISEDD